MGPVSCRPRRRSSRGEFGSSVHSRAYFSSRFDPRGTVHALIYGEDFAAWGPTSPLIRPPTRIQIQGLRSPHVCLSCCPESHLRNASLRLVIAMTPFVMLH